MLYRATDHPSVCCPHPRYCLTEEHVRKHRLWSSSRLSDQKRQPPITPLWQKQLMRGSQSCLWSPFVLPTLWATLRFPRSSRLCQRPGTSPPALRAELTRSQGSVSTCMAVTTFSFKEWLFWWTYTVCYSLNSKVRASLPLLLFSFFPFQGDTMQGQWTLPQCGHPFSLAPLKFMNIVTSHGIS